VGGELDNIFFGNGGVDIFFGDEGADTFISDANALSSASALDRVSDYTFSDGDLIDLSAILETFGAGQEAGSLVRIVANPGNDAAAVQIDVDGTLEGENWLTILRLDSLRIGDAVRLILDSSDAATIVQISPSAHTTLNANGTYVVEYADPLGETDWAQITNTYDSQHRIVLNATVMDNGVRSNTYVDAGSLSLWQSIVNTFDAQDQLVSSGTTYDDGSALAYFYDPADALDWQRVEVSYDSQGRLSNEVVINDDGTSYAQQWDVENLYDWSTITTYYDDQANQTAQTRVLDDGTIWYV
jgi:hypothetical protein